MENFITGHLLCENVDVYCGGEDKFNGKVIGCADGVLTLETEPEVLTHVAVDKIISVWPKSNGDTAPRGRTRSTEARRK
jgi:hypothetical protein